MNRYNMFFYLTVAAWVLFIAYLALVPTLATGCEAEEAVELELGERPVATLPKEIPATGYANYDDWFIANAKVLENCEITYYCTEKRNHICGTGDGITATGTPVHPYISCAVDPSVIPYGSDVMVDYGDHVEFWVADDCGGAIKGNHIDLALPTHNEALEKGVLYATVYFVEENHE